MPRRRKLTPAQEAAALAEYMAAERKWGTVKRLARKYNVSQPTMKRILKRAACPEESNVSRGTMPSLDHIIEEMRQ